MPTSHSHRPGGSWLLLAACSAALLSCASEEIPNFGDPAQVAGGVGGGSTGTTGSGGKCEVDAQCSVSFKDDIFPFLDGTANCAASGCHADGQGNLILEAGDAAGYYDALVAYQLDNPPDVGAYVVPCSPAQSKILCNLKVSDLADNPNGACGVTMPIVAKNGPNEAQLQAIEDWIACGAPDN
ncbi:MAG: hypothetical protein R3B70_46075 [Polyangiaceae bacterium]